MQRTPADWDVKDLEQIAEVSSGNGAPQGQRYFENGAIPFVRVQDLGRYGTNPNLTETKDYVNEIAVKEKRLKTFPKGTILFPKSGVSTLLNHRAILGVDACVVGHLATVRPMEDIVLTKWLYYYLCTLDFSTLVSTTTLPSLQLSKICHLRIPLPPRKTQLRLVSILERADVLKRKRVEANQLTKKIIQSFFLKKFGNPKNNPMNWNVVQLREVSTLITKGTTPTTYGHEYVSSGIPFVRAEDVNGGEVDLSRVSKMISAETHEFLRRSQLQEGDVLITIAGTIGRSAWVSQGTGQANVNQAVALARLDDSLALPEFISYQIDSNLVQSQFASMQRGVVQKNLNLRQVGELRIILPPLSEQERFASFVEKFITVQRRQRQSGREINELFNSLMQRAFRGELVT